MTTPPAGRIAYVDESLNARQSLYVLTAVIVDQVQHQRYVRALEGAAPRTAAGRPFVHATDMAAHLRSPIEQVLSTESVRVIAAVHAPIVRGKTEVARQNCLLQLAQLCTSERVSSMILDSRDDQGIPKAERLRRYGPDKNDRDLSTLRAAAPQIRARHGDDNRAHGLWGPDIAAYAVNQALNQDAPQRLETLLPKLTLRAAVPEHRDLQHRLEQIRAKSALGIGARAAASDPGAHPRSLLDQAQLRLDQLEVSRRSSAATEDPSGRCETS